jgi:hypothetical protein
LNKKFILDLKNKSQIKKPLKNKSHLALSTLLSLRRIDKALRARRKVSLLPPRLSTLEFHRVGL